MGCDRCDSLQNWPRLVSKVMWELQNVTVPDVVIQCLPPCFHIASTLIMPPFLSWPLTCNHMETTIMGSNYVCTVWNLISPSYLQFMHFRPCRQWAVSYIWAIQPREEHEGRAGEKSSVMSHNTLVTYTDKNSNQCWQDPIFDFQTLVIGCSNSEPLDKLWPVPSPVTHPDNPWIQVLSCTLWQTVTNSKSCHMPLSHALVTCHCHTPLSHTLGHPSPPQCLGLATTLRALRHLSPPQCSGLVPVENPGAYCIISVRSLFHIFNHGTN